MLRLLVEPIVRAALAEDLGRAGDITTDAVVPSDAEVTATMAARQPGVLAGLDAGLLAFELLDPSLRLERLCAEGSRVERGQAVARISGRARPVLAAERTALNLVCRLSGVATATRSLVDAVLLDNMDPPTLRRAVQMVAGRAVTEASGRITRETAPAIAAAGVDLISSGWITHSAPILDLGLDID